MMAGDENVREWVFDGTELEEQIGYSRAVVTGPWVHVAGTTGLDYRTMELPEGVVEQAAQCLRNIEDALNRAGAAWKDVTLVRYIFANREDFKRCWPLFRDRFHQVRPAATMFVAALATPQVLVEIEVVACKGGASAAPAQATTMAENPTGAPQQENEMRHPPPQRLEGYYMRSIRSLSRGGRLFLVAGLAASVLAACGGAGDGAESEQTNGEQTHTVRVATAVDQYYGYMVVEAHERLGTFEDTNLDVQVVSATTPTIGQIIAADQADIAMASGGIVGHNMAGIPIEFVASILTPWDYKVIVSEASEYAGADSIEELKGANFGITGEGSPGNWLLHEYADELGWTSNDFEETALGDVGSLFAAISSGQVDATLWAADQAYITEAEGVATFFDLPLLQPNVLQAFGVRTDFLENDTDTVQSFLEAYYAEVRRLQDNPQEFIDVLVEEWEVDPEIAERLAENQLPQLSTDGSMSEEELQGVAESAPFLSGQPDEPPPDIDHTPWQELGS